MEITTIGLDLAKNLFQVHGVNERGKVVLRKQLRRDQIAPFFANLRPCLVGIEACASAHNWARKLEHDGEDGLPGRLQHKKEALPIKWKCDEPSRRYKADASISVY